MPVSADVGDAVKARPVLTIRAAARERSHIVCGAPQYLDHVACAKQRRRHRLRLWTVCGRGHRDAPLFRTRSAVKHLRVRPGIVKCGYVTMLPVRERVYSLLLKLQRATPHVLTMLTLRNSPFSPLRLGITEVSNEYRKTA